MTSTEDPVGGRLAGGPISWGVCEVPGRGAKLPPDRVLAEMRSLGLRFVEAGPVGYLGVDAASVRGPVWYVLEQDAALSEDAIPPPGTGPAEDALRSIEFLRSLLGTERPSTQKEAIA